METFEATNSPAGVALPNQFSQIINSVPPLGVPVQVELGRNQMS